MQHEQSAKNIVISGWPSKNNILFDEDGLRKIAGTQSRQISINGNVLLPLFYDDSQPVIVPHRLFYQAC